MLLIIEEHAIKSLIIHQNLTSLSLLPKFLVVTCLGLHSRTSNREHSLLNPAQMWQ